MDVLESGGYYRRMAPDWTIQKLDDGSELIHWQGRSRVVTREGVAAMDPVGRGMLSLAFELATQEGVYGDVARFDVHAWIASGRTPVILTMEGAH